MTLKEIKSRKIIKTSQDKNRKLILLLAANCAITIKISTILIYQREFRDL